MLLLVNVGYLAIVAYPLLSTSYFFYLPSVLILLLASDAVGRILECAHTNGKRYFVPATGILAVFIGMTFTQNLEVLRYLRSPTNRQMAHTYLKSFAHVGDSVGIPRYPDNETFSGEFGVDPFMYRLCKVGLKGELLGDVAPDWLLWSFPESASPTPVSPDYSQVALFNDGLTLPRWRNNLYQESLYAVFTHEQKSSPHPLLQPNLLYELGEFVRKDPQSSFGVLQFQALPLLPQSLDLFRKAGGTVLPLPTQAFARGVRDRSSPLAYVHQVDRFTLVFWGVKYILAKTGDPVFSSETLASHRFNLERVHTLPDGVEVFHNKDYQGQALFLAAVRPEETRTIEPPPYRGWLNPPKNWGTLYSRADMASVGASALEVNLKIKASGPVDILLKGGTYRRSLLAGKGSTEIIASYETGDGPEDIGYEIHPAAAGTNFTIRQIVVRPLRLTQGRLRHIESTPQYSFATVKSDTPGNVVFAQPFIDGFWRASVDGSPAALHRGPANTVAVEAPAGDHLVSIVLQR